LGQKPAAQPAPIVEQCHNTEICNEAFFQTRTINDCR